MQYNEITNLFLDTCRKYNIKRVAIECSDPRVESSQTWKCGYSGYKNLIFADELYGSFPAIWNVVRDIPQIKNYCGNSGQSQIGSGHGLDKGVYEFSNLSQEWFKIS